MKASHNDATSFQGISEFNILLLKERKSRMKTQQKILYPFKNKNIHILLHLKGGYGEFWIFYNSQAYST